MDLDTLRDWLIQNGINESELNDVTEPPVINDMATVILSSIQANNDVADLVMFLVDELNSIKARLEELENA